MERKRFKTLSLNSFESECCWKGCLPLLHLAPVLAQCSSSYSRETCSPSTAESFISRNFCLPMQAFVEGSSGTSLCFPFLAKQVAGIAVRNAWPSPPLLPPASCAGTAVMALALQPLRDSTVSALYIEHVLRDSYNKWLSSLLKLCLDNFCLVSSHCVFLLPFVPHNYLQILSSARQRLKLFFKVSVCTEISLY